VITLARYRRIIDELQTGVAPIRQVGISATILRRFLYLLSWEKFDLELKGVGGAKMPYLEFFLKGGGKFKRVWGTKVPHRGPGL